jgi:restriction endonuclease S subunit
MDSFVVGTTNRKYIKFNDLLNDIKIPLPPLEIQKKLVQTYQNRLNLAILQEQQAKDKEQEIEDYLYKELGIQVLDKEKIPLLNFISFSKLNSWSYRDTIGDFQLLSSKYKTKKLNLNMHLYENIFRGKSPKYDEASNSKILNQKCVRWNYLEIEHSKKVNKTWIEGIDKKFFTKENDILINSTGDGTIGRATYITKEFEDFLYDSHILLIRVVKEEINALFLTYFLNSTLGQKQIENIKSAIATKQTELGLNNLKNIQFILPPIEIQNIISFHLDNLKNEIENLKDKSINNKNLALKEFEKEIFNEV